MNGNKVSRVLMAAAAMMFAASAAAQLPPQIGTMDSQAVEVNSIFPSAIPIINPNSNGALTNVGITVNLPAGLTGGIGPAYFDNPSCTGAITAGPTVVTVAGGVLPAGTTCILYVYHEVVTAGIYSGFHISVTSSANPTTPVESVQGTVFAYALPTASASFSPASRIAPGGATTLSFMFSNPDPNFTVNFDTIQPIGLGTLAPGASIFEAPPACASGEGPPYLGTDNSLNVIYINLPPGEACTVSVEVTGPALGGGSISEIHLVPDSPAASFTPSLYILGPPTLYIYPMPVTIPQSTLTVVGPELSASPLSVVFPATAVGGGAGPISVTVSNTGTMPLALSGPLAQVGTFSVSGTCPEAPATLAPATSCSLDFGFSPISPGIQSTSFAIQSDGGSVTISMSGVGVLTPPAVTWWLNPLSVIAGEPSSLRLQVSNANGASFDSSGFTYNLPSGLVAASSTVTNPVSPCLGTIAPLSAGSTSFTVSGLSVPSSGSCDYIIEVTSMVPGTYSVQMGQGAIVGSVFLLTGVTNAASNTATLTVEPAVPAASVSPASLTFADQRVGTASASQPVTLSNTGTGALNIASITVGGDFAQATTCGSTLAAGASCAIDVAFTPTATGTRSGVLTVTDDAPGSPRSVSLSGNGVAPVLSVSPMTVAFPGSTTIGMTSAAIPVTVTNVGGAPLSFSGTIMAIGEFNVASGCPLPPSMLAPLATCTLDVTFTPGASGTRNGTIDIASDGGSALVNLSGDGGLSLPAVTWNFSPLSVIAGSPSMLQLQINNGNGAPFDSSGFTYNLPTGLVVASSNFGYSASPCLGTMTEPLSGDTSFTVSGLSVPTFGACAYTIEVTSSAPGTYNVQMAPGTIMGSVLFQSGVTNASSNTASLVVTAAPAPVLSLSPAPPGPIAFGNVTVGSFSASRTVTLTNAGDAPLTLSGVATAPPFELNTATASPCPVAPSTLPASPGPGNTCTVEVRFAPTVAGPAGGTLDIASDGGNASLSLTGTGDPVPVPAVSLSPSSLTFASQSVGTVSGAQLVLLDNTGTAPLAISSITTGGDFAHSATCPLTPSTLAAGSGCDISVTFSPLLSGGRTGAVTITSNASGSPHAVSLSGTGTQVLVPAATVSPASLSFPQTQVGVASAPASIQVTNSGSAPLSVTAVRIVGAGFGVASDGCTGTIAVGASCLVTVVFTPPVEGSLAATLEIASNAPASPTQVALSGRGTLAPLATLAVSPGSLAFSGQTVDTTSPAQTVTITNTGGATASISGLTVSGDYAQTNNCASIPADGSCTISVTFTPAASGVRPGSIVLAGNASNTPIAIALSGTGVPPPLPVIELSVSSLSYGNTMIGRGAAGQAFTLRNAGGVPLTVTGMSVPAEFPVSSGCPAVVPAGESCRIDVGFLPHVSGPRAGRLDITSNASNGTKGVDLTGTGCRFTFLGRTPALICQ